MADGKRQKLVKSPGFHRDDRKDVCTKAKRKAEKGSLSNLSSLISLYLLAPCA
jgi:hypothetical protein